MTYLYCFPTGEVNHDFMRKYLPKKLIFKAFFATLLVFFSTSPAFAASLYLSPRDGSVGEGSSFSVQVRLSADGEKVNAVQANLSYPADKLFLLGIDFSQSAFEVEAETLSSNGLIKIARGQIEGISGDKPVATLNFKPKSAMGEADVKFASGSAVAAAQGSNSRDVLSSTEGAVFSLGSSDPLNSLKSQYFGGLVALILLFAVTFFWSSKRKGTKETN